MKNSKSLFFLISIIVYSLHAQIYTGEWVNRLEQESRVDYTRIRFYSEEKAYVNGDTTFIFPADYFTSVPHVHITIKLHNIEYSSALEFQPFVTEISPLMAKINVNKVNPGLIQHFTTEADTDDIIVQILAYGY